MSERLADLAAHVEYPPTPELAAAVRARIESSGPARRRRAPRWSRRTLVLALLAALLGGGVAAAAIPGLREAVGDLLGLHGAR